MSKQDLITPAFRMTTLGTAPDELYMTDQAIQIIFKLSSAVNVTDALAFEHDHQILAATGCIDE